MRLTGARVLVTGASGFVGSHLVPALVAKSAQVFRAERSPGDSSTPTDLRNAKAVDRLFESCRPDVVVHLGGMTYLPDVENDPVTSFDINVLGTLHVLESALRHAPKARILLVSSCSVYGEAGPEDLPCKEETPLRATHPYGVQKIGLERLGQEFLSDRGLDVLIARPFNHIGAGQDIRISITHFARQIVLGERGVGRPILKVGNLEARRDFLDIADIVKAYLLVLEHRDPPRVFNVARGAATGIGEALAILLAMSPARFEIERDAARFRRTDVPVLFGDASRLRTATGWSPTVALATTLQGILEHVRRTLPNTRP